MLPPGSTKLEHIRHFNTLRPRQNGRHFPDDIFNCIFLNENIRISLEISLKFAPRRLMNNIPALVQIMGWCRSGDKPLSEPMVVSLLTHIWVTRPQRVKIWSEDTVEQRKNVTAVTFFRCSTVKAVTAGPLHTRQQACHRARAYKR